MALALSDLITPQTTDQVQQTLINTLVALGITSASTWPNGATSRAVLRTVGALGAGFTTLLASLARSGFRDLAQGPWLTLWARSVYNVNRPLASAAAGTVRLTNVSGSPYTYGIGQVTLKNSASGTTYLNTAGFTLAASSFADVPFAATIVGAAGSAAPGAVDTLVTTMIGVTCSNVASLVGTDDLDDTSLGNLSVSKLGSLSPNGPALAYLYLAIADPTTIPVLVNQGLTTLTSSPITRVGVISDGAGGVAIYLANASGPASGGDVTIVNARIQAVATPIGQKATCFPANPVSIPVSYTAWLKGSSLTQAAALTAFSQQLVKYFAAIPLGGVVLPPSSQGVVSPNAIEGQLFQATQNVVKAVVAAPALDLTLTPDQVAVLGAITPTVNLT